MTIAKLRKRYADLMGMLASEIPFDGYIIIDNSTYLRAFCVLANRPEIQTIEQVEDLILGTLASSWTFNKICPGMPKGFPEDYGENEVERWNKTKVCPARLSDFLSLRIGTCASYAITAAVVLKVCDKAEKVIFHWGSGHMWVTTKNPDRLIDLSQRSHGVIPSELDRTGKSFEL